MIIQSDRCCSSEAQLHLRPNVTDVKSARAPRVSLSLCRWKCAPSTPCSSTAFVPHRCVMVHMPRDWSLCVVAVGFVQLRLSVGWRCTIRFASLLFARPIPDSSPALQLHRSVVQLQRTSSSTRPCRPRQYMSSRRPAQSESAADSLTGARAASQRLKPRVRGKWCMGSCTR